MCAICVLTKIFFSFSLVQCDVGICIFFFFLHFYFFSFQARDDGGIISTKHRIKESFVCLYVCVYKPRVKIKSKNKKLRWRQKRFESGWTGGRRKKKKNKQTKWMKAYRFTRNLQGYFFWHKQLIFLPNAIIWSLHIYCKEATEFLNASLWTGRLRETREKKKKKNNSIFHNLVISFRVCFFKEGFFQRYWAFTRDRCSRMPKTQISSSVWTRASIQRRWKRHNL